MDGGRKLRVGIIGCGVAGQAHAYGYRNASMAEDLSGLEIELACVVDENRSLAERVAGRYGATSITHQYHDVISDPSVDIISVALPNSVHHRVLADVLSSGKHVLAEKPLGRNAGEAALITRAAEGTGGVVAIGFSFRRIPGLAVLAEVVRRGDLGDIWTVDGWYHADYGCDPQTPFSWRYSQQEAGAGCLIDIGTHVIDAVTFVGGEIEVIESCRLKTVIGSRPGPDGRSQTVDNDDIAAVTAGMESGAVARMWMSRVACGTPNSLGVEVRGSKGYARFDSMSGNEVVVFENSFPDTALNGPRHVVMGPQHPYFSDVAPMPGGGVGTGYGEAFIAEVQMFLRAVALGRRVDTDLAGACRVMQVVDAASESARLREPVRVGSGG